MSDIPGNSHSHFRFPPVETARSPQTPKVLSRLHEDMSRAASGTPMDHTGAILVLHNAVMDLAYVVGGLEAERRHDAGGPVHDGT